MPAKKDNYYQHAVIIIEKMITESGLSQNKFAREILGIAGGNITEAKKTGKIPDDWFRRVENKLGVNKEELCKPPTKVRSALDQLYGDADIINDTINEPTTGHVRNYREISELDDDILLEIQTWLNDMEVYRPGFTAWFRLEFQNRFPEFDEWKMKQFKKAE